MATIGAQPWHNPILIAQLQPSTNTAQRSVTGVVTLIWPYSASRSSYSFLLVEPDFRLRRQMGQVRLHFTGSSAKAVARAGVQSGDRIHLSLEDVQWNRDSLKESSGQTPGRSIDWQLQYGERVLLQILREGQQHITVDIDHPPVSPQTPASSRTPPPTTPPSNFSIHSLTRASGNLGGNAQAWSSPAFLKRKATSNTPHANAFYDPFRDDHDYEQTSRAKRTKFGRKSAEWRFAERTPSPILGADIELEQQVEQQVDQEIGTADAVLQRGPPSPVSEPQHSIGGSAGLLHRQDQQDSSQDHVRTSQFLLETRTDGDAQGDLGLNSRQGVREDSRGLEIEPDRSTPAAQPSGIPDKIPAEPTTEFQTLVSDHEDRPTVSTFVEPSPEPSSAAHQFPGRIPTTPRHGSEPTSPKVDSDNIFSAQESDIEGVEHNNTQAEDYDTQVSGSQDDVPTTQTFNSSPQAGTPTHTIDEYLRQSNVGHTSSPAPTLEDVLRRSNQGSLVGTQGDDQEARRASSPSIVELSSTSDARSLRDSPPPSEEGSMGIEEDEDEDLDSDELSEGAYERHMTDFEDDESDAPLGLHTEAHAHGSMHDRRTSITSKNEDLSEGEYSEAQFAKSSHFEQIPIPGSLVEESDDPKVKALHEMLDAEEDDQEGEERDYDVVYSPEFDSDSDLDVVERRPVRMQQRASDRPNSFSPRTTHSHEGSGFGFDGSAFSRLSPTSAAWAAFDQIQNERHSGFGDEPGQSGQPTIARSPHGALNSVENVESETVKEDIESVRIPRDSQPDDRDFEENVEEPVQIVTEDESEDYWDEDGQSAEEQDLSSEAIESDIDEVQDLGDDVDAFMDVAPDPVSDNAQAPAPRIDDTLPVKSSTVEIIDLESSDDEEATSTPQEPGGMKMSDHAAMSTYPLITEAPESETPMQEDDEGDQFLVKKDSANVQSELVVEQITELVVEQITELEHMPSGSTERYSRREVHDTYSEDAGLSESDSAYSPIAQPEAAIAPPAERSFSPIPLSDSKDKPSEGRVLQEFVEEEVELELQQAFAQPLESMIDIHSQGGDFEESTQPTLRPAEAEIREIADSGTEDQPLHDALSETSDDLLAASQLFEKSTSELDQEELVMDQNEAPLQSNHTSIDDFAQKPSLKDVREQSERRTQLPTPTTTQVTKQRSELSEVSLDYEINEDTLPTPSLTQKTSEDPVSVEMYESNSIPASRLEVSSEQEAKDHAEEPQSSQSNAVIVPPTTPAQPRKFSLVEKLKEMRSESAKKRRSIPANDTSTTASPWFGPRRSSRLAQQSDKEPSMSAAEEEETGRDGDVSSDLDAGTQSQSQPSLPRRRMASPSAETTLNRFPSSSPPIQPAFPTNGFRTTLSYFAPLNTIRSHYNTTTSIFGLVIASTPIERSTTGPKDYHTTIYITDPSSSDPPSVTSARLFRPSRLAFPTVQQGDALLLRSFRVVSYRKQLGLLSTESSGWAVFRRGEEPQIEGPPVEFGPEERGFARGLWDWWGTVEKEEFINAMPNASSPRRGRPKGSKNSPSNKGSPSVLRHELRDGTTYVDRRKGEKDDSVHELRDGTKWSDSKL